MEAREAYPWPLLFSHKLKRESGAMPNSNASHLAYDMLVEYGQETAHKLVGEVALRLAYLIGQYTGIHKQ